MNEIEFKKRLNKLIYDTFDIWTLIILEIINKVNKILKDD